MKTMSPQRFRTLFLKVSRSPSGWVWAHGRCFQYAYCFMKLVGGNAQSYLTHRKIHKAYGHCFIKFNGLYFDSENHDGQKSWKRLQDYMIRAQDKRVRKHKNINGVLKTWGFEKYQIEDCEVMIQKILELDKVSDRKKQRQKR